MSICQRQKTFYTKDTFDQPGGGFGILAADFLASVPDQEGHIAGQSDRLFFGVGAWQTRATGFLSDVQLGATRTASLPRCAPSSRPMRACSSSGTQPALVSRRVVIGGQSVCECIKCHSAALVLPQVFMHRNPASHF
jgi:hypothetical protein